MRNLKPVAIPDGQYTGTMSGHEIRFAYQGRDVYCETDLGVRGINIPVTFRMVGNRVDEKTIQVDQMANVDEEAERSLAKAEKIAMWPEDAAEWTGFAGLPVRDVQFRFQMPDEASAWFTSLACALKLDEQ